MLIDERTCELLEIDADSDRAEVLQAIDAIALLKSRVKELSLLFNCNLLDWLQANGDLEHDTKRWYVGTARSTQCRDKMSTLNALFNLCNGDMGRVCEYLASSPFKHGSIKDLMDDETMYRKHFEIIEQQDVKTGKPKKTVQVVDNRYT